MVEDGRHIDSFDVEEFIVGERCVLTEHAEVCAGAAFMGHHLVGGVDVEQGHRLFSALFCIGKFLEHAHLEGAQDFASRTAEAYEYVVAIAKVLVHGGGCI